ncbi:endonuclease/exonuclease/phosphatase family protein [Rubrivirga sp.]|uniref:endonuclease/exonuclease/phosphatase family protein n=1 Tax=Rubrivirga sp. TaxID=1885344 RepID=UPI003C758DB1
MFVRFPAFAALSLLVSVASAQTVTPRGADATFDVATWNIEHFGNADAGFGPTDEALQLSNVEAVVSQSEIDLWAVQEIGSQDAWQELISQLQDDGYTGRLGPETSGSFQLRLGFIYDPSVVSVIGSRTILSTANFAGRAPFELQARVTVEGESRTVRFIALHADAGTSQRDYTNRTRGAERLKEYIDDRIARGESVVLLGDFNDLLTGSIRQSESQSPYAPIVADADYVSASLALEDAGIGTFCGSSTTCSGGSTIDHVVYTANFPVRLAEVARYDEVLTEVGIYTRTTSDHAPVLARFDLNRPVICDGCGEPLRTRLLPSAPNPFRGATNLRFVLEAASDVRLEVFDVLGRSVLEVEGSFGEGEHAVALEGAAWVPGAYVVRLRAGEVVRSAVIVRVE